MLSMIVIVTLVFALLSMRMVMMMMMMKYMRRWVSVWSRLCPSPSVISLPNTTALALEMLTQCTRASRRRLKLMSAASMPILAMPSHSPTYCERFSMNRATTSPSLKPRSSSRLATRLEYSSSCLKLHLSPVPSKISAVLSPYFCSVSAKILGIVLRWRRCRFTFSFTFNSTKAALRNTRRGKNTSEAETPNNV